MDYAPGPSPEQKQALRWLYEGEGRALVPAAIQCRPRLGVRLLTQRCLGVLVGALAAEMTVGARLRKACR